jgi:hypothetical protein
VHHFAEIKLKDRSKNGPATVAFEAAHRAFWQFLPVKSYRIKRRSIFLLEIGEDEKRMLFTARKPKSLVYEVLIAVIFSRMVSDAGVSWSPTAVDITLRHMQDASVHTAPMRFELVPTYDEKDPFDYDVRRI